MQCHEFIDQVDELLDAREAQLLDPQLAAHARLCERCGSRWQSLRLMLDACEASHDPPIHPPQPLARDVAASLATQARRRRRRPQWAAALVVAASLLAVASWPGNLLLPPADNNESGVSAGPNAAPAIVTADANDSDLASPLLWNQMLAGLVDHFPTETTMEPVDHVQSGIKPITRSLGVAFTAIRKTWPARERPEAKPRVPQALQTALPPWTA